MASGFTPASGPYNVPVLTELISKLSRDPRTHLEYCDHLKRLANDQTALAAQGRRSEFLMAVTAALAPCAPYKRGKANQASKMVPSFAALLATETSASNCQDATSHE